MTIVAQPCNAYPTKLYVSNHKMKLWKKILTAIFALILLCIGVLYLFIQSLPDMSDICGNQILTQHLSPNNKLKALTFQRDCGATTSFSTQVSILPSTDALGNEAGNIFVADTNHGAAPEGQSGGPDIQVNWLSDTHLQVRHHNLVRIHRNESEFDGVDVEYLTFQ